MNENEFKIDGKVYVATIVSGSSCTECALRYELAVCTGGDGPPCFTAGRTNEIDIIFVEKKP